MLHSPELQHEVFQFWLQIQFIWTLTCVLESGRAHQNSPFRLSSAIRWFSLWASTTVSGIHSSVSSVAYPNIKPCKTTQCQTTNLRAWTHSPSPLHLPADWIKPQRTCQVSWSLGRDLNLGHHKHKSEVLTTWLQCLSIIYTKCIPEISFLYKSIIHNFISVSMINQQGLYFRLQNIYCYLNSKCNLKNNTLEKHTFFHPSVFSDLTAPCFYLPWIKFCTL